MVIGSFAVEWNIRINIEYENLTYLGGLVNFLHIDLVRHRCGTPPGRPTSMAHSRS